MLALEGAAISSSPPAAANKNRLKGRRSRLRLVSQTDEFDAPLVEEVPPPAPAAKKPRAPRKSKVEPVNYTDINSLTAYLQDVYRIKLLTADEERELAIRIANGDQYAKQDLIQANLRLVISIAKKFMGLGMTFQDLIQEGNIGLMEAVDKFDHNRGCRFATYATWWIRQAIIRAIANQGRMIRLPVHIAEAFQRFLQISVRHTQAHGKAPAIEETSKVLFPVCRDKIRRKLSKSLKTELTEDDPRVQAKVEEMETVASDRLKEILAVAQEPVSLETPLGEEDTCLGDMVAAKSDDDAMIMPTELAGLLKHLSDRERKILAMRFGLVDGTVRTLQEISDEFGISKERIRQKEEDALRKLRLVMSREDWL